MRKCINIKLCFIRNLVRIGRGLQILDEFEFFYFFYRGLEFQKSDK